MIRKIEHDRVKLALVEQLKYLPPHEVYWRDPAGAPITAQRLLGMIERGEELVERYLEDVIAAAVRLVKVRVKAHQTVADRAAEPELAVARLACGWCGLQYQPGETPHQLDAHLRTCSASPFVKRLAAYRQLVEDLEQALLDGDHGKVPSDLDRRIKDLLDEEHVL